MVSEMTADVRLDAAFHALADPTRRALLARLARGEASVGELAAPFAMSQPAISKHLKVLERAGLVTATQDGPRRPRRLEAGRLAEVSDWLEQCRASLEAGYLRLDALLERMQNQQPPLVKRVRRHTRARRRRDSRN